MPRKIRIAYILPTLDKGGAERFTVDLILNLDRQVYSPILILFKRGGEWAAELAAENIPVIVLKKKSFLDPNNFCQLLSVLKDFRPDIVHTQLGGDWYGRLAAKRLGVPAIISTEQNINIDESWLQNILKRLTNPFADRIIAISQVVKQDIVKRYGAKPEKITVIPNGLPTRNFLAFQKQGIAAKGTAVGGTIGRLEPQKGQATLIKAGEMIKDQAFRLLIAGEGRLRGSLTQQIKAAGLEGKIELVGPVQAPAFLNSLDFFVLPSLWEGLGIVLLEAGLIGLPIIASAIDGIKEVLDEETGWLVPAGDEKALATKINWLIANLGSEEVARRRDNLQKKIRENFDIARVADQYQKIYQELLDQKAKPENSL